MSTTTTPPHTPAAPRPSASIAILSPTNTLLLLHRLSTSSAFPSAHVFPGGNLSPSDGEVPGPGEAGREADCRAYRVGGVRECFEESGVLLARDGRENMLTNISATEREEGRRTIYAGEIEMEDWIRSKGGELDLGTPLPSTLTTRLSNTPEKLIGGLIPFTHWITPPTAPKHFTVQMYLYLLPLQVNTTTNSAGLPITAPDQQETVLPTPDQKEHTTAAFLPPQTWLDRARKDVLMYPPQLYLTHLLSQFLPPPPPGSPPHPSGVLQAQRDALLAYIRTSGVGKKVISPFAEGVTADRKVVLGLGKPRGDEERVCLVEVPVGGGLRAVEVRRRGEVVVVRGRL